MNKIVAVAVLAVSLAGFAGDVGAQQPQGKVFGTAFCLSSLSCDARYDSTMVTKLAGAADICVKSRFSMSSPEGYFNTEGLDTDNCFTLKDSVYEHSNSMLPRCCIMENPQKNGDCILLCEQVSIVK